MLEASDWKVTPDAIDVCSALFAVPPVEWNRLPHIQDVTIRLVAEKGILQGKAGKLYLQGEQASCKVVDAFVSSEFMLLL